MILPLKSGTKFMKKGKIAESILEKKIEADEKVVKNVKFSDWKSLFGFGSSVSKTEEPVISRIINRRSEEVGRFGRGIFRRIGR